MTESEKQQLLCKIEKNYRYVVSFLGEIMNSVVYLEDADLPQSITETYKMSLKAESERLFICATEIRSLVKKLLEIMEC